MKLVLLFFACLAAVCILSLVLGLVLGFMPGIFPILILTTVSTAFVHNRLESMRIKKELEQAGIKG